MRTMTSVVRAAALASAVGVGVLAFSLLSGGGQTPTQQITSDTQLYCGHLAERVLQLAPLTTGLPRQEAVALAGEGRGLCARGEIRGGILRLRQAFRLMLDGPAVKPH